MISTELMIAIEILTGRGYEVLFNSDGAFVTRLGYKQQIEYSIEPLNIVKAMLTLEDSGLFDD